MNLVTDTDITMTTSEDITMDTDTTIGIDTFIDMFIDIDMSIYKILCNFFPEVLVKNLILEYSPMIDFINYINIPSNISPGINSHEIPLVNPDIKYSFVCSNKKIYLLTDLKNDPNIFLHIFDVMGLNDSKIVSIKALRNENTKISSIIKDCRSNNIDTKSSQKNFNTIKNENDFFIFDTYQYDSTKRYFNLWTLRRNQYGSFVFDPTMNRLKEISNYVGNYRACALTPDKLVIINEHKILGFHRCGFTECNDCFFSYTMKKISSPAVDCVYDESHHKIIHDAFVFDNELLVVTDEYIFSHDINSLNRRLPLRVDPDKEYRYDCKILAACTNNSHLFILYDSGKKTTRDTTRGITCDQVSCVDLCVDVYKSCDKKIYSRNLVDIPMTNSTTTDKYLMSACNDFLVVNVNDVFYVFDILKMSQ
jgi:hypothetical protein